MARRLRRSNSLLTLVLLLSAAPAALAQPASESDTPTARALPQQPTAQCFPECREGYVCHLSRCVSLCNPPCPSGQLCVEGRRCELVPSEPPLPGGAPVYEPAPPPRRSFSERSHSALAFHLGFGGDVERAGEETALASSYGFNLRSDVPVAKYLLLGPMFQFSAWRADATGAEPGRSYAFDIDLYIRGRIPIELESVDLQFWAGVPIGLTLNFLDDVDATIEGPALGWNLGVLAGGALHLTRQFGLLTEFGWLQHRMTHESDSGRSVAFRLAQATFNVGFIFRN